MSDAILVLNAGSSSIKFALFVERGADLELAVAANERGGPSISRPGSRVAAWVISTNEELMIARHRRRVIEAS